MQHVKRIIKCMNVLLAHKRGWIHNKIPLAYSSSNELSNNSETKHLINNTKHSVINYVDNIQLYMCRYDPIMLLTLHLNKAL